LQEHTVMRSKSIYQRGKWKSMFKDFTNHSK
jgi:hypothetical protein